MWDGLGWVVRMSWLGFVGCSHRPKEASHILECVAALVMIQHRSFYSDLSHWTAQVKN